MLFLFVYQRLFASFTATGIIRTEPYLTITGSRSLLVPAAPEASRNKLRGPCWGARLSPSAYFESKTQGALSELIVTVLTASPQKRLNACSLIIWILVNWINCWIETVLLKMTKTQEQGEQKGGLILFLFTLRVSEQKETAHTHTFRSALPHHSLSLFHTNLNVYTHTACDPPQKNEWEARCKLPCTPSAIRTKPIFKAQNKCQILFDAGGLWLFRHLQSQRKDGRKGNVKSKPQTI